MYLDGTIGAYLADAASSKPAPGGGSVSALVGALGSTMAQMSANLTIGKEAFKDVEPRVKELLADLARSGAELSGLVDKDVAAYTEIARAFKMPRTTEAETKARTTAVQKALEGGMEVPLEIVGASLAALETTAALADVANPRLISDVGVAAICLEAALRCAVLNVEINLKSMKNDELIARTRSEIARATERASALASEIAGKVDRAMKA